MLIVYCLGWWYGRGWKWRLAKAGENLSYWADYFSIGKLLGTMFSPYRQTLVGGSKGMQAFTDGLVSRFIGFFVRYFIIVAACIVMAGYSVATFILLLIWPLVPVLPLAAVGLMVTGVKL